MAFTPRSLLARVKDELRITVDVDDLRLVRLIEEAVYSLQQFKCKTLVDTVTDATTQTTMSPLDRRYVFIHVALNFDGDTGLDDALTNVLSQVRDK